VLMEPTGQYNVLCLVVPHVLLLLLLNDALIL
jgi:hypothetical protein